MMTPTQPSDLLSLNYDTVLFDLDGTLLDTLEDMWLSVNHVMSQLGFPERTLDEVRRFVGNGIRMLIRRATPEEADEVVLEQALSMYREYYDDHCLVRTRPYEGILRMLQDLKDAGCQTAIVTNKNAEATEKIHAHYFTGLIPVAIGQTDAIPKKPDPSMVQLALHQLERPGRRVVYIGDSDVDIQTAANSGLDCISCTWGFRSRAFLLEHGATALADTPEDITKRILNRA